MFIHSRSGRRPSRAGSTFLAVTAAAGLIALAACGSGAPSASPSTSAGSTSTAPTSAAPTSGAPTSGAPTSTGPTPITPTPATKTTGTPPSPTGSAPTGTTLANCPKAQLAVSLAAPKGAAGTTYYHLVFRNTGSTTCRLRGYPGVSFVSGDDGHQIGAPAVEDTSSTRIELTVQPGASAHVTLGIARTGNYDAATCRPQTARGLRVYPPGDKASAFVKHNLAACAMGSPSLMKVTAMRPGA